VKRQTATFQLTEINDFKEKMLNWANRFNIFIFLDSNFYNDKYGSEEWLLAVDVGSEFIPEKDSLIGLKEFLAAHTDWLFGHVNYDLKNEIEFLVSSHPDHIQFPDIYFFQPKILIRSAEGGVEISTLNNSADIVFNEVNSTSDYLSTDSTKVNIHHRIIKDEYVDIIQKLRQHILRGDCYEINFCQEFFAENAIVDPLQLYQQLLKVSPTPFAGFYKLNDKYLLCASPERFLKKQDNKIISQPIKGTIKRNTIDPRKDKLLKDELYNSQKDKSENVMVVDMIRNDLSKVCQEGSVHVEELYGIYSFPQVHQMISTIAGELKEGIDLADVLRATFPMGSMTGAPKRRVMELIEQYEKTKRGIYSGCIGYISPEGDFDFNVVIRSIMYNSTNKYISYQVGGGITFYSDPEKEYEECLLKAEAIKKVLN
jgi:para-aminobenzoate synthetase component 1